MTEPYHADNNVTLHHGDCLTVLQAMPDNSVDSIVTDPPYGLSAATPQQVADTITSWATGDRAAAPTGKGFMGRSWDAFVPPPAVWDECLRVLKPGGHMLVFAGSRTQDLMGLSIRLAGFEIRDGIGWIYGSGFPKSMDVSKAIDKASGAEREVVGESASSANRKHVSFQAHDNPTGYNAVPEGPRLITAPATPEAERWQGWGTALKPAIEPVIMARKPLAGTVAANVLEWGTGALNIDASRVAGEPWKAHRATGLASTKFFSEGDAAVIGKSPHSAGRWPANVLLDPEAAAAMDQQSGTLKSGGSEHDRSHAHNGIYGEPGGERGVRRGPDSGGASRFFPVFKYQAKAPKRERPVIEREDGTKVQHPTVKPLALMEWLVTLITPPGGVVLDPFAGSGTTLQAARDKGFRAVGVEADKEHCELIVARLSKDDGGLFAA